MLAVLLMLLPLLGGVIVAAGQARAARGVAFTTTMVVFLLSVLVAIDFPGWGTAAWGFEVSQPWLEQFGLSLSFGADSVSMVLVLLTLCVWQA